MPFVLDITNELERIKEGNAEHLMVGAAIDTLLTTEAERETGGQYAPKRAMIKDAIDYLTREGSDEEFTLDFFQKTALEVVREYDNCMGWNPNPPELPENNEPA